jgi:hypothetical protein
LIASEILTKEHKIKIRAALIENLCCYQVEGEPFMESIITGGEVWVY